MWKPEQRGQAVAVYSLMPLLGPVVGPICGAWIAQLGDYRWVVSTALPVAFISSSANFRAKFWAPPIVSVAVQLGGWFFLEESQYGFRDRFGQPLTSWNYFPAFPPVLLERKAVNMKKRMDTEKVAYKVVRTIYDGADREYVA